MNEYISQIGSNDIALTKSLQINIDFFDTMVIIFTKFFMGILN